MVAQLPQLAKLVRTSTALAQDGAIWDGNSSVAMYLQWQQPLLEGWCCVLPETGNRSCGQFQHRSAQAVLDARLA